MKVLGIDVGFGDCKVCFGDTEGKIESLYKFNSVMGHVSVSEHVSDKRAYPYQGGHFYVGPAALSLESSKIIDMTDYTHLETFTPLMVKYVIDSLSEVPEIIVLGLSIAHSKHSAYFRDAVKKYLTEDCGFMVKEVYVLPQGIGGKLAFDKYGTSFPQVTEKFSADANYIGVDIGFNTLDIFQVIKNRTSTNLFQGIENEGIVVIVQALQENIHNRVGMDLRIKEVKECLDQGFLRVRGTNTPLKNEIKKFKLDYIDRVKTLIEAKFGKVLDKTDEMRIFGGGAYILRDLADSFIRIPDDKAEFYNSIGQYLYAITKSKDLD